jgi:hypothetical protein
LLAKANRGVDGEIPPGFVPAPNVIVTGPPPVLPSLSPPFGQAVKRKLRKAKASVRRIKGLQTMGAVTMQLALQRLSSKGIKTLKWIGVIIRQYLPLYVNFL